MGGWWRHVSDGSHALPGALPVSRKAVQRFDLEAVHARQPPNTGVVVVGTRNTFETCALMSRLKRSIQRGDAVLQRTAA